MDKRLKNMNLRGSNANANGLPSFCPPIKPPHVYPCPGIHNHFPPPPPPSHQTVNVIVNKEDGDKSEMDIEQNQKLEYILSELSSMKVAIPTALTDFDDYDAVTTDAELSSELDNLSTYVDVNYTTDEEVASIVNNMLENTFDLEDLKNSINNFNNNEI